MMLNYEFCKKKIKHIFLQISVRMSRNYREMKHLCYILTYS